MHADVRDMTTSRHNFLTNIKTHGNANRLNRNIDAEFNSPFEEFSLLEELRRSPVDAPRIFTQKPLGIYVPSERMQLWQSGRSRYKVLARVARLSIERTTMAILPWLVPLLVALVLLTYIPAIALWLPRLAGMAP